MLVHLAISTALEAFEAAPLSRKKAMLVALLIDAQIDRRQTGDPLAYRANLAYALVIAGEVDAARTEIDVALSAGPDDEASRNLKTLIVDIQEGRAERPTRLALPPAARSAL